MSLNPYQILGLQTDCLLPEIKRAYKMAAKQFHPDTGGDPKQFALVKMAYDTLKDPDKRKKYDDHGFMDDDAFASKTEKATELLNRLFFSLLQNIEPDHLANIDFVGSMKINIEQEITKLEQAIASLKNAESQQKKVVKIIEKRLKRKNKAPNLLLIALQQSIANIPNQILHLKSLIEIQKEVFNLANDYTFDFENPTPKSSFSFCVLGV